MNKNIKYGLFEYHTENIGDEIQSIAARRFIPHVDYYFDRDNIDATITKPNETIKLIMNGWYTHHPENWPPKNPSIEPLITSIHIEQDAANLGAAEAFSSPEGKKFLTKSLPIGARNKPTKEFLDKNGIDSFFSGCITLTLKANPSIKKQNYILAVDVSDKVYSEMIKRTKRPVIRLTTIRARDLDRDSRFVIAEAWLSLYQSAHAVITTRLHTMLPCTALETPVFGISGIDPKRYEGLIDLVNHSTEEEFLKNKKIFNLDSPPKNPSAYKQLRKNLEKQCKDFTGFDSNKSFMGDKTITELLFSPLLIQFFTNATYDTLRFEETNYHLCKIINKPGIKESARLLKKAINNKLGR